MNRYRGFTLMELLIVVLIIGILAAIALPQYQKAVLKSRYSSLIPLAKAIRDGNEAYYLMNSAYTNDVSKLDVTTNANAQVTLGNETDHKYVRVTRPDIKNRVTMYQKHSINFPNETHCEALIDDAQANWLCRDALKGTLVGNKYGYTIYSFNEEPTGTLNRIFNGGKNLSISDGDSCMGNGSYSCYHITVSNGGQCVGRGGFDCAGSSSYSQDSSCIGNGYGTCQGDTFDHSYCVANFRSGGDSACRGGTFSNYSICYANKLYTCTGTYDGTSCCVGGDNCPAGTKCEDNDYWGTRLDEIPDMPTYP